MADISKLMSQFSEIKSSYQTSSNAFAQRSFDATVGIEGQQVTVTVSGAKILKSVNISNGLLEENPKTALEMVCAAVNKAMKMVDEDPENTMVGMQQAINGNIPGFDMEETFSQLLSSVSNPNSNPEE